MKFPDQNIVGKASSSRIMKTEAWADAKENGNYKAANQIIEQLWNDKKTEQLKKIFPDPENVMFISQPSTSGDNVLTAQFAKKLSANFKTDFIVGDDHTISTHLEQSKKISFTKRAFHPREYEIVEVKALKEAIGNKDVCLVEDVITSGGSVASFTKTLDREGIEVKSIAALTGEKRLNIDEKTHDRLEQALKAKNININLQELTNSLTRMEAGGIIMTANSAKSENAIEKLETDLKDRVQHEKNMEYPQQMKESEISNTLSDLVTKWNPGQTLQENSNPEPAIEVPEQSQIKEKENPKEQESVQLGHDHTPEQMKPERDPNLSEVSPKIETGLDLPKLNTSYKHEWAKELDESQKLVDQEYSKEMPQEQEKHQEQLDQLKQSEQGLEKEPQIELGR
jgi:orotate phosphoribosyltransferase